MEEATMAKATKKKILQDVFARGDRYFDTGDLAVMPNPRTIDS